MSLLGCCEIEGITIPETVLELGDSSLGGCDNLRLVIYDNHELFDRDKIFGGKEPRLFDLVSSSSFTHPTLDVMLAEQNLTRETVTEITIPYGFTELYDHALEGCVNLTQVKLPNTMTTIGKEVLKDCSKMKHFELPESVMSIAASAFKGSQLEVIEIPKNVKVIRDYTFQDCEQLRSVILHEGIISIDDYAFHRCKSLQTVNASAWTSLRSIGRYAFSGCEKLTSVPIHSSVMSVGAWAFQSCKAMNSVKIADGTELGKGVFQCSNQKSTVPTGAVIKESFYACCKLDAIKIPDGVKGIENAAFMSCGEHDTVVLPSSIETIHEYAFRFTGIKRFVCHPTIAGRLRQIYGGSVVIEEQCGSGISSIDTTDAYAPTEYVTTTGVSV